MFNNGFLLGIDIGTSSCKTVLFDTSGNQIYEVSEEYPVYYPENGMAEQNADEWYAAMCRSIRKITDIYGNNKILGVGIDGQSWSCILCGRDGNALANSPIWFDRRSTAECEYLNKLIGEENIFKVSGNPLQPVYTTPKDLWFQKNAPELYKNTYMILQSNSYMVLKLTGKFTQDRSQGYAHFFYDVHKREYDAALAHDMGVEISMYPELMDSHEIAGTVTAHGSLQTGLLEGTPVVAGGLDAAAGTLGAGVYAEGQAQEMSGTSGGMSICMKDLITHPSLIAATHVVSGMGLLQGGTVAGGGSYKWFAEQFGKAFGNNAESMYEPVNDEAQSSPVGSRGIVFLPYMAGERSPIWDPNAKGVFFGLSYECSRGDMARAVMEGSALSLRHNLETAAYAGASPDTLYASGGATKSDLWMHIKADVTGKNVAVPHTASAASLGSAMLAGIGCGVYNSFQDAVEKAVRIVKVYEPNYDNHEIYDKLYDKYVKLYLQTKDLL